MRRVLFVSISRDSISRDSICGRGPRGWRHDEINEIDDHPDPLHRLCDGVALPPHEGSPPLTLLQVEVVSGGVFVSS